MPFLCLSRVHPPHPPYHTRAPLPPAPDPPQRALKLKQPEQLLPYISRHLKAEPYSLAELQSADNFGVHPNTLFEGASRACATPPPCPTPPYQAVKEAFMVAPWMEMPHQSKYLQVPSWAAQVVRKWASRS